MSFARALLVGLGVVALGASSSIACSTTNVVAVRGDGGTSGGNPSLPEIPADQLGAACSGFGTSIGDTALFPDPDCAGGSCLVDARTGLESYCSADCDKVNCPTGYLCQPTSLNPDTHACFIDPNAPADDGGPGADGSPTVGYLDVRLPAYKSGQSTLTDLALDDYADPTGATRDLVIVLVQGRWSPFDLRQISDLNKAAPIARAELVSVLIQGEAPNADATSADLTAWHTAYPNVDTCLDPELAQLGVGLGAVTAFPSWFVFSARTMKLVASEQGYMEAPMLATTVESWRAMAK